MCVMLRRVCLCLQLQMPDVSCWRPDAPGTTKDGVTHDTLTPDVYETADGPVLSDVGRKQVSASHELDTTESACCVCRCTHMYTDYTSIGHSPQSNTTQHGSLLLDFTFR